VTLPSRGSFSLVTHFWSCEVHAIMALGESAMVTMRAWVSLGTKGWESMTITRADHSNIPQVPLAGLDRKPEGSVVDVCGVRFGGREIIVIAGPCAVENRAQIHDTAKAVKRSGALMLRGGAYKPRTAPYSFQGLQQEGLELLAAVRQETGLPIVTEVMDTRKVETVCRYADVLQIGTRNMQNFELLREVGNTNKPVLLKRGMSATIDEFLYAAEYILDQGNQDVILCERGIRTFESATRNTLDLNAVPLLKRLTHLPVVVDPSHGTGHWWMVPAMAKGAVAVGADGLLVEVHRCPGDALSDGYQSLRPDRFDMMMRDLRPIALAVGRDFAAPRPGSAATKAGKTAAFAAA
jgi:3-deoxy-7-phosphoheptulonate synthase